MLNLSLTKHSLNVDILARIIVNQFVEVVWELIPGHQKKTERPALPFFSTAGKPSVYNSLILLVSLDTSKNRNQNRNSHQQFTHQPCHQRRLVGHPSTVRCLLRE